MDNYNSLNNQSSLIDDLTAFLPTLTPQDTTVPTRKNAVTYDALMLDAAQRQALVTIRSLGRHGLHVGALEVANHEYMPGDVPAFASRWCGQTFLVPSYNEHVLPYLAYLRQILNMTQARVIIPAADGTVALLRQYRQQLEQHVKIALAREPALSIAIDKEQTLALATSLGIAIPRGVDVTSVNDVPTALHEVGLPAVVKPSESWVWGEEASRRLICTLVTTPDEARRAVEQVTQAGGRAIFQQFLSGRREAVSFLYADGQVYARFAQWAKRTMPPLGGSSVLRQSIAVPDDIGMQSERLIREIDLEGYAEVEFRRDSSGTPYLMEINPRLSASVEIAVRSGVDFPYLLYRWANGDQLEHVTSYRTGHWMRHLGSDIVTTVQALEQRGRPGVDSPAQAIGDFCSSFFQPMNYDYLTWHDLRPAYVASLNFAHFLKQQIGIRLGRQARQAH